MTEIYQTFPFPTAPVRQAVALGFFDGVHRGHQALLGELRKLSQARGLRPAVFSFASHPHRPEAAASFPGQIQTLAQRTASLSNFAEALYLAPTSPEVMDLSPEDFVRQVLSERLRASVLVCGHDFRFGRRAQGNLDLLEQLAAQLNFELLALSDLVIDGDIVSSTRIRKFIQAGEMEAACKLLGRPFAYAGRVMPGRQLGRKLGFPTVNLEIEPAQILARPGVYASRVKWQGQVLLAVSNLGYNPTVATNGCAKLETFIYDFDEEIYGQEIEVELLSFSRPEAKLKSLAELQDIVARDLLTIRQWHLKRGQ